MNYDSYGEVENGQQTYRGIAEELPENAVIIGWTDKNGTHFDILFVYTALGYGDLQGGLRPRKDLFVSIMRYGAFAFEVNEADTHPGYYEEKLATRDAFGTELAEKIAELINGVRRELHKIP